MNVESDTLAAEIRAAVATATCPAVEKWGQRLGEGLLTRDENPVSHFSVYFLPYNPVNEQVFLVHHRKAGLWIAPGGHIDRGESLLQTLRREMREELGVQCELKETVSPFLLTITPIDNTTQLCKEHFDIWFAIGTDGKDFSIDPREFAETKWLTVPEARQIVTDPPNLAALDAIEVRMKQGRTQVSNGGVKSLSRHLEESGMTFEHLVKASGLEAKLVKAIISGNYTPSPVQRQRLAAVVGLTANDIAWGHAVPVEHMYGHGPQFGRTP